MNAQMESDIFKNFDLMSIIVFSKKFKLVYNTNSMQGGAPIWLFNFLTKKLVYAVPNQRLKSKHKAQTSMFSVKTSRHTKSNLQVVKYLIQTYVNN